jgi:hypothetical protein
MVTAHVDRTALGENVATVTPLSEMAAAIAIIVLSVLGLVGVVPGAMLAIATIVAGAAILLQGAQLASEFRRLLIQPGAGAGTAAFGSGITLDFLAGGTGIVLGIIGLFRNPGVLLPAALIVFGATLLLSGATAARTGSVQSAIPEEGVALLIAEQMAVMTAGAQVLIGIAAVVLGILALISIYAGVLTLVGLLAVGGGLLMVSAASSGSVLARSASL